MKSLLKILAILIVVLLLVIFGMGITYFLPYPYSRINLIFAAIILFLVLRPKGYLIWISFFAHFLLELFASTPFGILLISGTLGTLFSYWAYQYIFSNRSWYALLAMSTFTILVFRLIYLSSMGIYKVFGDLIFPDFAPLISGILFEILFTNFLVFSIYIIFFYKKDKNYSRIKWYAA